MSPRWRRAESTNGACAYDSRKNAASLSVCGIVSPSCVNLCDLAMASPTILLIEDDADDAALIVDGLARAIPREQIEICRDGAAALDFLHGRGDYAQRDGT